jgi:hypothetical protein
MKTNHRSPKVEKKQYLRYMKTFLWAKRRDKDELIQTVMGRHMDNYPASAISLEQAVTDMDAESELRQTGLSMTDMYAIKEVINLIENNVTNTTSTANRTGNQEDEVPNGHLSIQGDSEVFDKLVEEGIIGSGEDSESQYD